MTKENQRKGSAEDESLRNALFVHLREEFVAPAASITGFAEMLTEDVMRLGLGCYREDLGRICEAGVDILPVAIGGSHRVMPRGGSFLFRPAVVEVRIGEPIPTAGLTVSDRRELAGRVRESVCALHEGGTEAEAVSADCPAVGAG